MSKKRVKYSSLMSNMGNVDVKIVELLEVVEQIDKKETELSTDPTWAGTVATAFQGTKSKLMEYATTNVLNFKKTNEYKERVVNKFQETEKENSSTYDGGLGLLPPVKFDGSVASDGKTKKDKDVKSDGKTKTDKDVKSDGKKSVDTTSINIRTTKPSSGTEFYTSKDNPYAAKNFGQCTCYAYGRFNEIADSLGTKKFSGANFGNGGDFIQNSYGENYSSASKENFDITYADDLNDLSQLQPGDLIVWGDTAGAQYGHVGVVEKSENGQVMISNGNAIDFNMNYGDVNHLKRFKRSTNSTYYLKGVIHQTEEN